jgi:hypothetical protein
MGFLTAQTLAPRTGPFLYGFLVLSYSMVMTAFAVLLEFGTSIVHPDDSDVLGGLPIPPRTIFLARLINLLFYTFLIGTCLCLPPALFGLAVRGEPKSFPLVFFPVSLAANLAAASSMVLVYTLLLRLMRKERAKDAIAGMQIVLSFVVFFSYQVAAGFGKTSFYGEDPAGSWLYALPSAWFAGAVQTLLKTGRPIDIHLALCALVGTVFLFGILFRNSSFDLAQVGDGKGTSRSSKPAAADQGSAALVLERGGSRISPYVGHDPAGPQCQNGSLSAFRAAHGGPGPGHHAERSDRSVSGRSSVEQDKREHPFLFHILSRISFSAFHCLQP